MRPISFSPRAAAAVIVITGSPFCLTPAAPFCHRPLSLLFFSLLATGCGVLGSLFFSQIPMTFELFFAARKPYYALLCPRRGEGPLWGFFGAALSRRKTRGEIKKKKKSGEGMKEKKSKKLAAPPGSLEAPQPIVMIELRIFSCEKPSPSYVLIASLLRTAAAYRVSGWEGKILSLFFVVFSRASRDENSRI